MARAPGGRIAPMQQVDLNADLGEEVTDDAALLDLVTSANLACGFHAGNEEIMRVVCAGAARRGVRVGAQVSYRDREGFGRRRTDVDAATLTEWVHQQVALLSRIAQQEGAALGYLKPHGALYNRVVDDEEQAAAVLAGSGSLPVLGLPGGALLRLAGDAGRAIFTEGFPDRGYEEPDEHGVARLVPRDRPGALVEDPEQIAANAVDLAAQVHSVCVHGDGEHAVDAARRVRRALEDAGLGPVAFT